MTDAELTKRLFVRDEPVPADLAMVFGAANEIDLDRRTRCGVELYRSSLVPKLLVTGGGVLAQRQPEAKRMADLAREMGVRPADLLVEDRSASTFENVQFSLAMLNDRDLLDQLSSVLLVSSEWHMRRVLLTAQRFFPPSVRLMCCPTLEGCTRDNWTASPGCRDVVLNEAMLLDTFVETGALDSP